MTSVLYGIRTRYRLYRLLHVDELHAIGLALRLPGRRYWDLAIGGLIIGPLIWLILALTLAVI